MWISTSSSISGRHVSLLFCYFKALQWSTCWHYTMLATWLQYWIPRDKYVNSINSVLGRAWHFPRCCQVNYRTVRDLCYRNGKERKQQQQLNINNNDRNIKHLQTLCMYCVDTQGMGKLHYTTPCLKTKKKQKGKKYEKTRGLHSWWCTELFNNQKTSYNQRGSPCTLWSWICDPRGLLFCFTV